MKKHAFLIGAYQNPEYLEHLVSSLKGERSLIYIHINSQYLSNFQSFIQKYQKDDSVKIIHTRKIKWGGVDFLYSITDLMSLALQNKECVYFHMLTGQDILLRPLSEFYDFFDRHEQEEFIEYGPDVINERCQEFLVGFNRSRFYHLFDYLDFRGNKYHRLIEKIFVKTQQLMGIRRKWPFPNYYKGLTWFSLTRGAVEEITSFIKNNRKIVEYTFAPDEVIFQSILINSQKKYKIVNNNLRFIQWDEKEVCGSPDVLAEKHFQDIIKSDCFFARKIEPYRSKELINLIQEHIISKQ